VFLSPAPSQRCFRESHPVRPSLRRLLPGAQPRAQRAFGLFLLTAVVIFPRVISPRTAQTAATKTDSIAFDPGSFATELHALQGSIDKASANAHQETAIAATLPATWKIDGPDGQYDVPTAPLRRLLVCPKCDSVQQKDRLDQARILVGALAAQAKGYASPAASEKAGAAREKLDAILSRREFSSVRPRTQTELLRQRFNRWLLHMLQKLFEGVGKHPMGAQALFWLIVFALVGWLALTLIRFWIRRARIEELKNVGPVVSHRSWQEWIRAGRDAAARGDFREAVHSVYWAGVTHLEDSGIIQVDRTRTPREHLVLLAAAEGSQGFSMRKRRDYLAALTSRFERVWYGDSPAGNEDFQACLQQAEELGCRLP
jgi:Domain of unknown function (DUF4129)